MPDLKITGLTADTSPTSDDLIPTIHDPAGTPANRKVTLANAITKAHGLSDGLVKVATGTMSVVAATTASIAASTDKNYVTDAQATVIGNTSGTNTGDQTTVSGNAGSATVLQTARTIAGVSFNGSANITIAATNLSDSALLARLASPTFTGTVVLPASQAVNGVTLISGGAATEYLSRDGTYTTPAGGGGSPVGADTTVQIKDGSAFAAATGVTWAANQLLVAAQSASVVPQVVRMAASQTANAFEVQTSASAEQFGIREDGAIRLRDGGNAHPPTIKGANSGFGGAGAIYFGGRTARETAVGMSWTGNTGGVHVNSGGGFIFAATTDALSAQTAALTRVANGIVGVRGSSSGVGGTLSLIEQTAPAAPAANGAYIYADDNGGSTRLMVRFATGSAYQIASDGNTYFDTNVGIGVTPTARLHLAAGTASAGAAPFKLTSGTVNTTPEAGTLEFTNSETGLTFVAVATRRQVVLDTATQTVSGKRNQPRTNSTTNAATLAPDLSAANFYYRTTQTETLTISAPIGSPVIGETLYIEVSSVASQTLTINATYIPFGAAFPAATTAGKSFLMTATFNGTNWRTTWANQF